MVVVFSQMTQQSSEIEAADASEDDIEFMNTAEAVVKSYKASSTDTTVYLYVRDAINSELNTTHTGTSEWKASSAQDRLIDEASTFTLDDATVVAASTTKEQTAVTVSLSSGHTQTSFLTADLDEVTTVATTGAGTGLTLDCVTGASGGGFVVSSCTVGAVNGVGYAVGDTITAAHGQANIPGTQSADLVVTIASVAAENGTPGNFTKVEDSDQGVTAGPNVYLGSTTPLKGGTITIKRGNEDLTRDQLNETDGTFSLSNDVIVGTDSATETVKASYSFSAQDVYTALAAGSKRVHVTSSSDATGEWIMIEEVTNEGVTNANWAGGILAFDAAGVGAAAANRSAGTYTLNPGDYTTSGSGRDAVIKVVVTGDGTTKAVPTIVDGRAGIGFIDNETITIVDGKLGSGGAGSLVITVDGIQGSAAAAVDTGIFMGSVKINTDASAGAADNGQVWVQDGDTLTASFYKAKSTDGNNTTGALIKSTTATIDATAPTISNISPADGSLTSDKTPTLEFTLEDGGSGFSDNVANIGNHVTVEINGCAVPWTSLFIKNNDKNTINISYSAPVDWTTAAKNSSDVADPDTNCTTGDARAKGGFNVAGTAGPTALTSSTVHGTKFNWYVKATDLAGNEKVVGVDDHNGADATGNLDLRIDTQAPAATAVTGAKAWSTGDKKDVTNNASVKISFDESLLESSVDASDFTVSGVGVTSSTIETVTLGGKDGTTGMSVYLLLGADLGPNAKPKVKLVGQVSDLAGNILKPATSETTGKTLGTSTDGVKPTLTGGAVSEALIKKSGKSDVTFTSNENLTKTGVVFSTSRGTYLSVSGGGEDSGTSGVVTLDGTGDAGNVAVTLSNPKSAKGTLKHGTAENAVPMTKTGIYGLASVGRDAADNIGVGGITKVIEDVSASFAANSPADALDDLITRSTTSNDSIWIKLKNWPLADHDGDGSLMDSITDITVGGSAVVDLTYVDANAASTASAGGGFYRDSEFANHADTTFTITGGGTINDAGDDLTVGTATGKALVGSGACDGATVDVVLDHVTQVVLTVADITVNTADSVGCAVGETLTVAHTTIDSDADAANLELTITALGNGTVDATDDKSAYISKIDWSETESVELTVLGDSDVNIVENSTVKVTYYYVNAEQVVELDLDAPTVTIAPANLASTTDKTPSLSFAWDDDEYAGDTNTTVTMTKATLLNPDASTTDVLADVSTTDNKTFYYVPIDDLANGEYKITVSAQDVAGNEKKDQTSKFTVKDRSKTTVAMVPGWNLISLPGAAADSAINSVITNTQVDTVLTYDPSTPGGWLTAVRDGDSLVGTLDTIDDSHAYWIFQKNGDDIKVDIPGYKGGASSVPPVISVVEGWNLVPAATLSGATEWDADTYFSGLDWVKAKGYNATSEAWIDIVPDISADNTKYTLVSAAADNIYSGRGYWLYSNAAGVIVP